MRYSWIDKTVSIILVLLLWAGLAAAKTQKAAPKGQTRASAAQQKAPRAKTSRKNTRKKSKKSSRRRGQSGIDSARARQIQEALIREKYLEGEPSGVWDQRTKDAMARFQADNGWQTKVLPDARALIKLGLGPDHSKLINPETAATSPHASSPSGRQQ